MGWADCGTDERGRRIGYAIRAKCDKHGCKNVIDRGLSYVCGGMHGGDGIGCGGYFCEDHLYHSEDNPPLCGKCLVQIEKARKEEA